MAISEERQIVNFVINLPVTVNPYKAVAQELRKRLQPPPCPAWVLWLERLVLLGFIIMLLQASYLIYIRIKTKTFKLPDFNEMGLLRIDVTNMSAILYHSYAQLVIADMVLQELVNQDKHDQSGKIWLFGIKFLVILECSSGLLWVCACRCAALKWDSGGQVGQNDHTPMPAAVRRIMHTLFALLVIAPWSIVCWAYGQANAEYLATKNMLFPFIDTLERAGDTYDPKQYTPYKLLNTLIPAQQASHHVDLIARYVKIGIWFYLSLIGTVCIGIVPLLVFSLKALYNRAISEKKLESVLVPSSQDAIRLGSASRKTRRQRNALVRHVLMAYASTLVHVPVIVWQLTYEGNSFLQDKKWLIGTRLGLHGPFSIMGNIVLFILIRNALVFLEDENPSPTHSASKPHVRSKVDHRNEPKAYRITTRESLRPSSDEEHHENHLVVKL